MNTGYLATAVELSYGKGKLASGVSRQTRGIEQSQCAWLLLNVETCKKKDCEHVISQKAAADKKSKEERGSAWSGIKMYHYISNVLHYI